MSRFFVSGLVNLETTLAIDGFPLAYFPVRYPFFGVNSSVSGVGFNLAKALTTLGDDVEFATLLGQDENGRRAQDTLAALGVHTRFVLHQMGATPQSVILYDPEGNRQIHVDLKDIQSQTFPVEKVEGAIQTCDMALLCNINFTRPLIAVAQRAGKPIITDVHALADLQDDYNREFLQAADILFLSDERLPGSPEEVARELMDRYKAGIVVIGLGAKGALLVVRGDGYIGRYEAVQTRPVVNTIGAGDALLAAFVHHYVRSADPYNALKTAMVFASYKVGSNGAAEGYLPANDLALWVDRIKEKEEGNG